LGAGDFRSPRPGGHDMLNNMRSRTTRQSMDRYRDKLRKAGLRPVQIWLPDTRAPGFPAECRKQIRAAAAASALEVDVLQWIEGVQDTGGWRP
jgi:Protein  of unknown function (DUF3018)